MRKFLFALTFAALAMVACKKEGGETTTTAPQTKEPMRAEETKKDMPAEAAEPTGGTGGEIGVAECDEYVTKMRACLDKMPAEAKAASQSGFEQSINAWKQAASNEAAKPGLASACKSALDALAQNPVCK